MRNGGGTYIVIFFLVFLFSCFLVFLFSCFLVFLFSCFSFFLPLLSFFQGVLRSQRPVLSKGWRCVCYHTTVATITRYNYDILKKRFLIDYK